jgi:hypothetical protein
MLIVVAPWYLVADGNGSGAVLQRQDYRARHRLERVGRLRRLGRLLLRHMGNHIVLPDRRPERRLDYLPRMVDLAKRGTELQSCCTGASYSPKLIERARRLPSKPGY